MGSYCWNLLAVGMLMFATALPVAAVESDIEAHGIEVAVIAALTAVQDVTAPWQPLFLGVDEVAEGNNPIVGFGAVAARADDSVSRLVQTLPGDSVVETIQTGSIPHYEGHGAVTFAVLQSPLPAESVEGAAVEFAFYWRSPGAPTQPANLDANGDAAFGATNSFSIGAVAGEPYTTFSLSDGVSLVEQDSRSIAAWQFVADDLYNVAIAIPGLPEAVWGSALYAESTTRTTDFAIQIVTEVTGFSDKVSFTLAERGVLRAPDMTTAWLDMTSDGRAVADLAAGPGESEASPDQVDAGVALPANPPVEVDVTGRVVELSDSDASGSLWRWIVGVFAAAGLLALLLWLIISRREPPPAAQSPVADGVRPQQANNAGAESMARPGPMSNGPASNGAAPNDSAPRIDTDATAQAEAMPKGKDDHVDTHGHPS